VLQNPQTEATGLLQSEGSGDLPVVGLPLKIDGERPIVRLAPPRCGEHTTTILAQDLGVSAEDIKTLHERGIVCSPQGGV
jgi:crotonobetainyl-CoA:carnitine CoA-transferase CaiB-like acyl-CoA transferase